MVIIMKLSKLIKGVCFTAISILILAVSVSALNGQGTSAEPYTISTANELAEFSQLAQTDSFEGKVFVLSNDIELIDKDDFTYNDQGVMTGVAEGVQPFTPIGTKDVPFKGLFDGNGYSISGLYFDGDEEYSGLFGYVENADISNVTIFDSLCFGKVYAGLLCAYAGGETAIYDVNSSGAVIGVSEGLSSYIGGTVGFNGKDSILSDSVSYACVSGTRAYSVFAGGVVGLNLGTVTRAAFGGKIHSEAAYFMSCCGGVVGGNRGYVECVVSEGQVSGETSALVTESYVGGVVGQNVGGTLTVCVNYGPVSNSCYNTEDNICAVGGVVGMNIDGGILQSANYGNITADSVYAGGIAGIVISDEADSNIEAVHNRASISSANGVAGGIAGLSVSSSEYKSVFDACLNTEAVSGSVASGILAQTTDNSANSFVNCYYGINSPADANAASVTESTLKSGTALTGFATQLWSFTSGNLPFVSNENALIKPSYLVCPQREVVLYTGNEVVPGTITLTKGNIKLSEQLKDMGIYNGILVCGDMTDISGYFAPAPCRMDVAIVADMEKSQILSAKYDETDASQLNVVAYLPEGYTQADFVTAVYVDDALSGVKLETKQIDDDFYVCTLKLHESAEVQSAEKCVEVFVFDSISNMKPVCESKKI